METTNFWAQFANCITLPFDIEDVTGVTENAGSLHIDTKKGTYFVMIEKCAEEDKKFLCVDMSGRGGHVPFTFDELKEMDDEENPEHLNDDGETMAYWAEGAEVSDECRKDSQRFIRVE